MNKGLDSPFRLILPRKLLEQRYIQGDSGGVTATDGAHF
jgi:hypothetical protein